ncbi:MAG: hypothetical protein QM726_21045 [Chitinophagaceae bacterium]
MKIFLPVVLLGISQMAKSQQIDSICFHLYTDSLKKGTFNYINVDGKLSNNKWLPLTQKEIVFSASAGSFEGNSLFIDSNFTGEKITVKALLKAQPALQKDTTLWIKKLPDNERLPTDEEMPKPAARRRKQ